MLELPRVPASPGLGDDDCTPPLLEDASILLPPIILRVVSSAETPPHPSATMRVMTNESKSSSGKLVCQWVAFGLTFGVVFGAIFHSVAMGIVFGVTMGAAIGPALTRKNDNSHN